MKLSKLIIYIIAAIIGICVAIYLAFLLVDGISFLMDFLSIQGTNETLNVDDIRGVLSH